MIVAKHYDKDIMGKLFKTQIGYHYKIYKQVGGKYKTISQSYVYFHSRIECERRMKQEIEYFSEIITINN